MRALLAVVFLATVGGGLRLGAQRREVGPTVDAAPPPSTPPTPPTPSKPYTDGHWYPGFEDNLYAGS